MGVDRIEEPSPAGKESFRAFVIRHATSATRVQLLGAIASATAVMWLASLVSPHTPLIALSIALLAGSVTCTAVWGLLFGHARRAPTAMSAWTARGLLLAAALCAIAASFALLLGLLGQPWIS